MPANPAQLNALRTLLHRLTPLSDQAWSAAESLFDIRDYAANEHLIHAGKRVSQIYFLLSGITRFYYLAADGKEFNKSFSGPGHAVSSILSLVTGKPSPFYVQAITPTQLLTLNYEDMLTLCRHHQEWVALRTCLLEQLAIKKEQREADFLLLSATERYQKFLQEFAHLAENIPNFHIASYIGITEVALSRIRKQLGLTEVKEKNHD